MRFYLSFTGIPQIVLLTKADKICPKVDADISLVFKSEEVKQQVFKISQLLGIPVNQVLPIKNYITEIELNENVSILALLSLRQILRASEDYLYNFIDEGHKSSDDVPD